MVDESKVRIMTRLAMYEQTQGKEDFKISEYYRKDYTGMHIIFSILWTTIGYVCIVALAVVAGLKTLLANMSTGLILTLGVAGVVGYFAVVIVFAVITSHIYNKRHKNARQRVKRYNHDLVKLLKMYEKENK